MSNDCLKNIPTTIQTKINSKTYITSSYREYRVNDVETWKWETFLWKDKSVDTEYGCNSDIQSVLKLHSEIFKEYR